MPGAYYNEIDPYAAQWLRNLIAAGHIAPGDVDERSILDVRPSDLRGYTQCHFFAGIGVWSYALRLAGWPDERPVWTGSCPCQPFSVAGMGSGFNDERHLWPFWFHLIEQCRPAIVLGEQVEAAIRHGWLDLVQADLEGIEYAVGRVGIPAAGVGAPHIRQRLWFVADAMSAGRPKWWAVAGERSAASSSSTQQLGNTEQFRPRRHAGAGVGSEGGSCVRAICNGVGSPGAAGGVADAFTAGLGVIGRRGELGARHAGAHADLDHQEPATGPTNGLWRDADWLLCRDGKWRPVEPGTFPLANGASARVGRLRAYGNAINAEVARAVIESVMEDVGQ